MSVWTGWQADLLTHSGIPNTGHNRSFLSDWHSHAETNCHDNPVDLSVTVGTSTNCAPLPAVVAHAQAYPTTGDAVHAWDVQIHQAAYADLLSVMLTGDPYTATGTGAASEAITAWGSETFAQRYFTETANAPGRGGGIVDADALKGWQDIRHSVNRNMPAALRHSDRQMVRALHALGRARKVKL